MLGQTPAVDRRQHCAIDDMFNTVRGISRVMLHVTREDGTGFPSAIFGIF